jgi:hypothetical protein
LTATSDDLPAICWTMSPTFEVWASGRGIELNGDLPPVEDLATLVQLLHVAHRVHRDLKRGVGTEAVMRGLIGRGKQRRSKKAGVTRFRL